MLNRIGHQLNSCAPSPSLVDDKWARNEAEDMKKGIEYLYEFKEKLLKLHPVVMDAIEVLLQRPRY